MRFRPCIDLHDGLVKQIVGSTLSGDGHNPTTNFVAEQSPAWFAELYRRDRLTGGHVIKLGPGNDAAARQALAAWPGGMQIGGGINAENAGRWLDAGASHVIVTSYVFRDGLIDWDRLAELLKAVGKERLVLDLSCRRRGDEYLIVTDRWQRFTKIAINPATLAELAGFCDEFLIHAADVEGKCAGIELPLLDILAHHCPIAVTYAGGIRDLDDIKLIGERGRSRVDFTVGSALDIFGGGLKYEALTRNGWVKKI
ncbi:MAG: phosphoribosylformimino-5-aminoimidazole carboxamide ribotide isomerase [Desulfobulbaceae bacterium]|jgi:phosphoribosylformimino-5-aminoimidazole carboxamide ribotide isomerase|nr:phosphoribosylformimino-5-aminoimidazole carboxamide ribotide isomerase [Desulfobulbaceae bacterium]